MRLGRSMGLSRGLDSRAMDAQAEDNVLEGTKLHELGEKSVSDKAKIEAEIEKLENENEELTELLQTDEVSTNSVKLQEISSKIEKNTNRLEELMERWESIQ